MKGTAALFTLVAVGLAQTAQVRGRIDRYLLSETVTAPSIKVVLCQGELRRDSTLTDQAGMYYFSSVSPDTYRLLVVPPSEDPDLAPFDVRLRVRPGQPVVDVAAELLNRVEFGQAIPGALPSDSVTFGGRHSFPDGTTVWFLFHDASGEYSFLGGRAVLMAGRPWSVRLDVPPGATEVAVALMALDALRDIVDRFNGGRFGVLDRTLRGRRIISVRDLPID